MYIYRGGQLAEAGIYLESVCNGKIVLKACGFLPGTDKDIYFKLPECYLLIPALIFGLILSIVFPYGVGAALFVLLFMLHNMIFSLVADCEKLMGCLLAHVSMSFRPGVSYFSGKSGKIRNRKKRVQGKKDDRSSTKAVE